MIKFLILFFKKDSFNQKRLNYLYSLDNKTDDVLEEISLRSKLITGVFR